LQRGAFVVQWKSDGEKLTKIKKTWVHSPPVNFFKEILYIQ
jgi:hypothetical protein